MRGPLWTGGAAVAYPGIVIVGRDGRIAAMGPDLDLPRGLRVLDSAWIGPGIVDAHVHLGFASTSAEFAGGLIGVRDLGAPPRSAAAVRTEPHASGAPGVSASGPIFTAPGGYPSTSWGRGGYAAFLDAPEQVARQVRDAVRDGADLIKIALEPGDGRLPVPGPDHVRAVVDAAHAAGVPVTAHALSVELVSRALDGGVDELAHVPVELLPPELVERIAESGIPVVSTLQAFFSAGIGRIAGVNAAALHAAGVPLVYGTDLGNTGTMPGVDPRELDRLADAGLGRLGALRAATQGSAVAAGMNGRGGDGLLRVGATARVVALAADPLVEPAAWRSPRAVISGRDLLIPDVTPDSGREQASSGPAAYPAA